MRCKKPHETGKEDVGGSLFSEEKEALLPFEWWVVSQFLFFLPVRCDFFYYLPQPLHALRLLQDDSVKHKRGP
jgi:hypothetical protein